MKFDDPLDQLLFYLFHGVLLASPVIVTLAVLFGWSMVKPVRENELATRPNCEGILPPWASVAAIGRAPWLEMNTHQGIARLGW